MAKSLPKLKTADIQHAFRKRFCHPEWASFFEVSNATGFAGGARYMDGLAMSLYPSRGLELHGFEFKVSRGDWTRELKAPDKAEMMASRCHYWWVITANDIVKAGEMPTGWGHMILSNRGLVTVQKAPRREAPDMTWEWLAAILRRAGQVGESEIRKAVEDQTKQMRERMDDEIERRVKARSREAERMQPVIDRLEELTGTHVDGRVFRNTYELEELLKAALIIKELGLQDDGYGALRQMVTRLNTMSQNANAILSSLPKPKAKEATS